MSATMQFYNDIDPKIKNFVKNIWFSSGTFEKGENKYLKLLPMDHMDLIVRKSGEIKLIIEGKSISPSTAIFQGLHTNVVSISQRGPFSVFGISFTPWGLYPFINQSIDVVLSKSLGYKDIGNSFIDDVVSAVEEQGDSKAVFLAIESVLIKHLQLKRIYLDSIPILKSFINGDKVDVNLFCDINHIHRRKLERDFKKFVGVSPNEYRRIKQLVETTRHLLKDEPESFTEIGQLGHFYDQSHFIRNFKKYIDYTPKDFKKEEPALKSKIKFE